MTPHNVGNWVRCCENASYSEKAVTDRGIAVHWWSFPDGEAPPKPLIEQWLDLCFSDDRAVAVHCVAGLGRAPLLVAIALIEAGLDASFDGVLADVRARDRRDSERAEAPMRPA